MARFCINCGMELSEGAKFCKYCGAPVEPLPEKQEETADNFGNASGNNTDTADNNADTTGEYGGTAENYGGTTGEYGGTAENYGGTTGEYGGTAENYGYSANAAGYGQAQAVKQRRPLNKKLLAGICAAAAAVIVIILIVVNMGKTVDLTNYIEIRYVGPDGYASATAVINEDALTADMLKKLGYKDEELAALGLSSDGSGDFGNTSPDFLGVLNNYGKLMTDAEAINEIFRNIDITLDKSENISNGDTITATVKYNGNGSNSKFSVKDGEKAVSVTGLQEVKDLDPFENIKVVFSGVEPYGTAVIEGKDAYSEYGFSYSLDKDSGLSVGDTVTLSVSYNDESLLEQGLHLTSDTKEYKVEKLDDAVPVDVFGDLNVQFEGTAPFVYATLDGYGKYISGGPDGYDVYVSYSIENPENLNIGDTVKVKAEYDPEDFAQNGIVPESDIKEVTVGNMDHYLQNVKDMDRDLLESMKKECSERLDTYLKSLESDEFSHSGEKFAGAYVLTRKPENDSWDSVDNCIFMLYRGKVKSTCEESKIKDETEVVYAFRIDNIIEKADGTQTYDADRIFIVEAVNEDISAGWAYLYAYPGINEAYDALVVQNEAGYTATESDKAAEFRENGK